MSEHYITPRDLQAENEALMRESESGACLVDAYRAAIELVPGLVQAQMVGLDNESTKTACARKKWAPHNTSGVHEVHIRLSDLRVALLPQEKNIRERPDAIAMIAEKIGREPQSITPQQLHIFSFLHELGHVSHFINNESDPAAYEAAVEAEKYAQPLGDVTYRDVMNPSTPIYKSILQNPEYYETNFGTSNFQMLANMQAVAYRRMTHEAFADDFAGAVIKSNPQLLTQLQAEAVQ